MLAAAGLLEKEMALGDPGYEALLGRISAARKKADELMLDGDDWINLAAFHSVGSMQLSDAGHLYVLVRRSALERLDFSGAIAACCSS
jgi:hypothetical protein